MEKQSVDEAFFSMKGGEGPHSYAHNSTAQRVGIEATKSIIQRAIVSNLDPKTLPASSTHPFCVADLGCSTGPNTFIAIEYILEAIELQYKSHGLILPEFQVFFNDQKSNDFNTLFRTLPSSNINYFAAGVPGSFYGRLFPRNTLCFVHSTASLNWISKVPREITDTTSAAWNKGRIYYTNAPKEVVDAYSSQYRKDMEIFLQARAEELVGNGLMALLIPAAADDVDFDSGLYPGKDLELLGTCLVDMAKEGKVKEEVDYFNLPIYFPPLKDLKKILESDECFSIEQMETVEGKKIPFSVDKYVHHHRAALEGLIQNHFGGEIVDELFDRFAKKVKEFPDVMDIEKLKTVALFVLLKRKLYYHD